MARKTPIPLVALILLLAACSTSPAVPPPTPTVIQPTATLAPTATPPPSPTPETVSGTLTIWHTWNEGERTAWPLILHAFNQEYPNVLFDVLYVPAGEVQALFQSEAARGRGPAILLAPAELGPSLFAAGLVQDIAPMLSAERLSGLNSAAVETSRFNGALIGAPYSIQGVVLYRNKDIVTLSPATWEELVTLAQTSTQGEVLGAFLERSFFYSGGHLNGLGGSWLTAEGAPTFNDPTGLEWVELLKQFDQAGPTNYFSDADLERFKTGTVGWIIDGTWNLRPLAAALGPEKLAIDPWPAYENGRLSGFVLAENLYLNADLSVNELTARTFVDFFLSAPAQTALAEVGRIPAAGGVSLSEPGAGQLLAQAMAALAGGAPYPVRPEMITLNLEMDLALRSIFDGSLQPAQALDQAAAAIVAAGAAPTPAP